jgi:hypothetical protein
VTFITSCPYTITQPGQHHLAQNLTCTAAASGIIVLANDVELHFDGHTLTGNFQSAGVLTAGFFTNLSIHGNGTIAGVEAAETVKSTPKPELT